MPIRSSLSRRSSPREAASTTRVMILPTVCQSTRISWLPRVRIEHRNRSWVGGVPPLACWWCAARWEGTGRGPLSLSARPHDHEGGPVTREGAERACERSRPRSGLDGERGRGRLPGCEAPPVTVIHADLLTRTAIVRFLFGLIKTPKRRTNDDGRHIVLSMALAELLRKADAEP